MKKYIVYYRVSTERQGQSGLGLEAQQAAVRQFLSTNKATELPPSFTEIESGRNDRRLALREAINRCKETGSTLLIAKLDRLARNVSFIFTLKEELERAGVGFIACDLPEANTLTIGLMASFAQFESERISSRTKAALQAKRERGEPLGKPENFTQAGRDKAHRSISELARTDITVRHAWHFIKPLREQNMSYQKIAHMLNEEGYKTRRGNKFYAKQVHDIVKRFTDGK